MKSIQILVFVVVVYCIIIFSTLFNSYKQMNWIDEYEYLCSRVPSSKFSYGCETQEEKNTIKCMWGGVGVFVEKKYMECGISSSLMNEGYPVDKHGFIEGMIGVQYCTANSTEQAFKNCVTNLPIGLQNNRRYMVVR